MEWVCGGVACIPVHEQVFAAAAVVSHPLVQTNELLQVGVTKSLFSNWLLNRHVGITRSECPVSRVGYFRAGETQYGACETQYETCVRLFACLLKAYSPDNHTGSP